jgi:hypothetical protein
VVARRIKKKDYENLTSTNIRHVTTLLTPPADSTSKPITKKEACSILNISYNTVRLGKIIEEQREKDEFTATRKAANSGKRARPDEIISVVSEYLQGEPVSKIAAGLYRSSGFCKAIIERIGVPTRLGVEERRGFDILPEACIADRFRCDQVVWSAKYHRTAIIVKEIPHYEEKYSSKCYQISVIEPVDASDSYFKHIEAGGFNAFALAYDLGSLEHLTEYGVDLSKI